MNNISTKVIADSINESELLMVDLTLIKLEEHGYESALKGLALSYYREGVDFNEWFTKERRTKACKQLQNLAFKGGGHNKAVASIFTWWLVTAPRGWWQEMDTYTVGGVTKNSASTMHTLSKELVTKEHFASGTSQVIIDNLNELISSGTDITILKMNLPESYLQTRELCINYMSLQNIIKQRTGHRLKMWDIFINRILAQVEHPKLLRQEIENDCK
jgi:hypothetical protein